ncbi:MAG: chromosomal replication initiator DnaA [Pseudomonadota bacterium]
MEQITNDIWGPPADRRRDHMLVAYITALVALFTDQPAREIAAPGRTGMLAAHGRNLAIYLSHVALSWPLSRVATNFGRDRTTVSRAVHAVEDLRDDPAFDARLTEMEAAVRMAPRPMAPRP